MFQGFTRQASEFYWDLMLHNERPWFMEHKADFVRLLKDPFQALAEDTLAALRQRFPERDWRLHVSRIYRDARRLHGRGPYKEQLWFTIRVGEDTPEGCVFWFELSPAQYRYGVGAWASPAQMERWRQFVDANPAAMERLARRCAQQDRFVLDGEEYKRPKTDRGALLNPWLNRKTLDLACRADFGGALLSPELPEKLAEDFGWLMPYFELFQHLYDGAGGKINGLW